MDAGGRRKLCFSDADLTFRCSNITNLAVSTVARNKNYERLPDRDSFSGGRGSRIGHIGNRGGENWGQSTTLVIVGTTNGPAHTSFGAVCIQSPTNVGKRIGDGAVTDLYSYLPNIVL